MTDASWFSLGLIAGVVITIVVVWLGGRRP